MPNDASSHQFQSVLAPFMVRFLKEKHTCGYSYAEPTRLLHRLDDLLLQEEQSTIELPRTIVWNWLTKRPHESASSHQQRVILVRHFSKFLLRAGHAAYVPDPTLTTHVRTTFVPRMLTNEELHRFFRAVDALKPTARSPFRHLVMPEVFRLLYGCGFRANEVLKLRVRDVDLNQGVITVYQGKFRKDRLVPPTLSLVNRLRKYANNFGDRPPDAIFFPVRSGKPFALRTVYTLFRGLLLQCGIPHGGSGKGPRIHDFRHLFAVHRLRSWYQQGVDLEAKLPLLSTYLGHRNLSGTKRYLHLTAEIFPEISARVNAAFGEVIPRRVEL
jgi:integrase/recombinase XerD